MTAAVLTRPTVCPAGWCTRDHSTDEPGGTTLHERTIGHIQAHRGMVSVIVERDECPTDRARVAFESTAEWASLGFFQARQFIRLLRKARRLAARINRGL